MHTISQVFERFIGRNNNDDCENWMTTAEGY